MLKSILFIIAVFVLVGCSHQGVQPTPPTPLPPAEVPVVVLPVPPVATPTPPVVTPVKPTPVKPPAKPVPPVEKPLVPPPAPKPCVKGGCSGQLCIEEGSDGMSTCEFKPEYACYKQASCERQKSGNCGWTSSAELTKCIEEANKPAPVVTPEPQPTPTPARAPQTFKMNIAGFAFSQPALTIKAGDTVEWTQVDSIGHNVISDSGSELSSALLSSGQTYAHTFTKAGTFPYHCGPHPSMKGTVIVE